MTVRLRPSQTIVESLILILILILLLLRIAGSRIGVSRHRLRRTIARPSHHRRAGSPMRVRLRPVRKLLKRRRRRKKSSASGTRRSRLLSEWMNQTRASGFFPDALSPCLGITTP